MCIQDTTPYPVAFWVDRVSGVTNFTFAVCERRTKRHREHVEKQNGRSRSRKRLTASQISSDSRRFRLIEFILDAVRCV